MASEKVQVIYGNYNNIARELVDFGLVDERGRAVGVNVFKAEHELMIDPNPRGYGYIGIPGYYFVGLCQPARNGKDYGSTQGERRFATAAERDEYVERSVADTRKRYGRKYGKAGAAA